MMVVTINLLLDFCELFPLTKKCQLFVVGVIIGWVVYNRVYGAFALDVNSLLNENLGGILDGR
jgi:uncharacterized membrane protein YciS (DUF1049 family)